MVGGGSLLGVDLRHRLAGVGDPEAPVDLHPVAVPGVLPGVPGVAASGVRRPGHGRARADNSRSAVFRRGACSGVSRNSTRAARRRASAGPGAPYNAPGVCAFRLPRTTRARPASGCHSSHSRRIGSATSAVARRPVTVACRRPAVGSAATNRLAVPCRPARRASVSRPGRRPWPRPCRRARPGRPTAGARRVPPPSPSAANRLRTAAVATPTSRASATSSPVSPPSPRNRTGIRLRAGRQPAGEPLHQVRPPVVGQSSHVTRDPARSSWGQDRATWVNRPELPPPSTSAGSNP